MHLCPRSSYTRGVARQQPASALATVTFSPCAQGLRACGKALELCAWKAGHIPGALEPRRVNSGPAARQHHKEWRAAAVALTGTVIAGLADPVRVVCLLDTILPTFMTKNSAERPT